MSDKPLHLRGQGQLWQGGFLSPGSRPGFLSLASRSGFGAAGGALVTLDLKGPWSLLERQCLRLMDGETERLQAH